MINFSFFEAIPFLVELDERKPLLSPDDGIGLF